MERLSSWQSSVLMEWGVAGWRVGDVGSQSQHCPCTLASHFSQRNLPLYWNPLPAQPHSRAM